MGITVNRNAVPFDPRPPAVSSGLRIGTPALATRGFRSTTSARSARSSARLSPGTSTTARADLSERTRALAERYPLYPHLTAPAAVDRRPLFELERVEAARDGRPVLRDDRPADRSGRHRPARPLRLGQVDAVRLLNRLADPDEGSVRFHGDDVRSSIRSAAPKRLPRPAAAGARAQQRGRQRPLRASCTAPLRPGAVAPSSPGSTAATPTATPRGSRSESSSA